MPPTDEAQRDARTEAVEDYLTAIWRLGRDGAVGTSALARALEVSAPSATEMLKRLAEQRLVRYQPYRGVELASRGRRIALRVIRAHRLVELFLSKVLGLPWERVHQEAHRWEHVISEEALERIAARLGHPSADVHGHPIPAADGTLPERRDLPLLDLPTGQSAVVTEVGDHAPALLQQLDRIGLRPGVRLMLIDADPADGFFALKVGRRHRRLGLEAAEIVRVASEPEQVHQ
jgi:DtxR family Mn-dependent transcriptional regulator